MKFGQLFVADWTANARGVGCKGLVVQGFGLQGSRVTRLILFIILLRSGILTYLKGFRDSRFKGSGFSQATGPKKTAGLIEKET